MTPTGVSPPMAFGISMSVAEARLAVSFTSPRVIETSLRTEGSAAEPGRMSRRTSVFFSPLIFLTT